MAKLLMLGIDVSGSTVGRYTSYNIDPEDLTTLGQSAVPNISSLFRWQT